MTCSVYRRFDKEGYRLDWWEPETEAAFLEKEKCIKEQYNNFNISYLGEEYSVEVGILLSNQWGF